MKKLSKFIPFSLLIIYYLLIFKSQLNSNIKLYIALIMVIISFILFWFRNKQNIGKKKLIPLIISLVFSVIISTYYLVIF